MTTTLIRKQEMYILREQEYRNTIVQMKKQIELKSQKPLELTQEKTDDQLQLIGLKLQLNKDKGNAPVKTATTSKGEQVPIQKDVKNIHFDIEEIMSNIQTMHEDTKTHLGNHKQNLWSKLDKNLERHKKELMEENNRRQETNEDFSKVEKTLKDRLETMTKMAQQIDEDNRKLMKRN